MSRLDRRITPRPLPGHLASAMLLWLSSRAALTSLQRGWPPWSGWASPPSGRPPQPALEHLQALAAEIECVGPDAVAAALDGLLSRRAAAFLAGLEAYRRHPFRRAAETAPVAWRRGAARLLDFGVAMQDQPAVLIVPSLINRYYIVDLLPERSFVRDLAAAGVRPLVLDWGEPGEAERGFALDDYVAGVLDSALSAAVETAGRPIALAGYCMGGLLALAAAMRRPERIACLALLATPWDFHAERRGEALLLGALLDRLPLSIGNADSVPVSLIQALFVGLDPFLAERKFVRFADLDLDSDGARGFVALEDWINDGVPLARRVAVECAQSWYGDNDPARGFWRIAGQPVRPAKLSVPALVVLPSRDRIVPPRSAEALLRAIPGAAELHAPFGHIGLMASAEAPMLAWRPIGQWLRANSA